MQEVIVNILVALFLVSYASALPGPAPREKAYDLIKCTAARHGTIWASFGHIMSSSDPEPRYFFTEVSVIDNTDALYRRRFWDHREGEAAGAIVVIRKGGMKLEFPGAKGERHEVTLVNSVRNDPNSFMGNWELIPAAGEPIFDSVACTAL
jgi:hypothetical protein